MIPASSLDNPAHSASAQVGDGGALPTALHLDRRRSVGRLHGAFWPQGLRIPI